MTKKRGRPPKTSATSSPTAISSSTATVGGHESVAGLRKLIKKESEPYLDDFAPWQLRLWVVDIPLNSPNLVGDIFTTQPNENNIHIIVELPTSPSGKRKNEKSLSQIKFLMNNSSCGINESKINKRRIKKIFKSKNDL
ncbi:unnamed protein product [Rhizophagus irregularis]|nr:unnamed protein product [Rhizophagus irregularis]